MPDQTITFNFAGSGSQLVSETKKIEQELNGVNAATQRANAGRLQGNKDGATAAQQNAEANKALGGGIAELAAKYFLVTQAIQAVIGVAKPAYDALIGQNVELQQQLLSTQASLAATNKIIAGGVEITDPTKAIQALEGPVNAAIDKIRKGSLELVGVTSQELIPIFQNVAGQSSAIGASLDDSAALTLKFAATLGTLNVPLEQQRQEISSILQGTIDQNSIVAKTLGITNDQVNNWKTQGTLVTELSKRLEPFVAGNALAAQTIGGISSNIKELFDNVTLAAGKPLTAEIAKDLNEIYKFLTRNQDAIQAFVTEGADKILFLINAFKEGGSEIQQNFEPIIKELQPIFEKLGPLFDIVVIGLEKLAVRASEIFEQNPALKAFLAIANGALTAVLAIESLNGEYAAGTEAAEIYGKQTASVAEEAIAALDKTQKGSADAPRARTEAIAKINDQLNALKASNVRGEENRAVIRGQVSELEIYKKKLEGGADGIKLISKDTQQYTNQLKQQTEVYKQASEALAAQTAIQNAALNQARARRDISEREFAARSFAVEQASNAQKVELARKRISDIAALQAETTDPQQKKEFESDRLKAVQEEAQTEISIAQKTIAERKRLQEAANQDLETEQKKAADAITSFKIQKQTDIQEAINAGLVTDEVAATRKLGLTQSRINAEIALEEDKTRALQALKFSDPQEEEANQAKIRASRQQTAQLTLQALENQRATEMAIAKIYQKAIADRADQEKNQFEARQQQITGQLKAQELLNNSLDRQGKLLKAQSDLASAQANLSTVGGQIEVDNLNRALEIRKKLNDAQTSPEVKAVLRSQLELLTGNRNASEAQIIAARVKAENEIAQIKRLGLAADQQAARANLDLELQRNKLAADRLILETQNAQLAARQSLNDAQANLDKLKADPKADPQQVKNAEAAVDRATGNVGFADKVAGDAKINLQQQDKLAAIAQTAQTAQQRAAIAQFEAADGARLQAAQLALVEAKATNIAEILKSVSNPRELDRTVEQLVERNRRLTNGATPNQPATPTSLAPIATVPGPPRRLEPTVQPIFNGPIAPVNAAIAPVTPAVNFSADSRATVGQLQALVGLSQQLLTANKDLGSTLLRIANRPISQSKITVNAQQRDTILEGTGL